MLRFTSLFEKLASGVRAATIWSNCMEKIVMHVQCHHGH